MVLKFTTSAAASYGPTPDRGARAISFAGDDASLVAALERRHPAAVAAFHDRYAQHMLRILVRILGRDPELEDVHHEVFVRALSSIGTLKDPACLTKWMVSVAVFSARTCLQRRYRGRWLSFLAPDELGESAACDERDWDARAELDLTYAVLARLPADERIVFTLRFVEGMELAELASACKTSLATVKRRLKRAESRFVALARRHPVLSAWLDDGGRWSST